MDLRTVDEIETDDLQYRIEKLLDEIEDWVIDIIAIVRTDD